MYARVSFGVTKKALLRGTFQLPYYSSQSSSIGMNTSVVPSSSSSSSSSRLSCQYEEDIFINAKNNNNKKRKEKKKNAILKSQSILLDKHLPLRKRKYATAIAFADTAKNKEPTLVKEELKRISKRPRRAVIISTYNEEEEEDDDESTIDLTPKTTTKRRQLASTIRREQPLVIEPDVVDILSTSPDDDDEEEDDDNCEDGMIITTTDSMVIDVFNKHSPSSSPFPIPPLHTLLPPPSDIIAWRDPKTQRRLLDTFTPFTNKTPPDPKLVNIRTDFEDGRHDYYVRDVKCTRANQWYSYSGLGEFLWPVFDQAAMARRLARPGQTEEMLLKKWDDSRDFGTRRHNGFDCVLQDHDYDFSTADPLKVLKPQAGFSRAMAELTPNYDIDATELTMYDEKARVISTTDLVLRCRDGSGYVVAEFKNCEKPLEISYGKKGTHPLTHTLMASKLEIYTWQLSFYAHLMNQLERYKGKVLRRGVIINFTPSDEDSYSLHWVDLVPMEPLWALLPWKIDDPRHGDYSNTDTRYHIPRVSDNDPACHSGHTKCVGYNRLFHEHNFSNFIWVNKAYGKTKFADSIPSMKKDSVFRDPNVWYDGVPPRNTYSKYEHYLLSNKELLREIPSLIGKTLVCWCKSPDYKCHANVLAKYANLHATGVWHVDQLL